MNVYLFAWNLSLNIVERDSPHGHWILLYTAECARLQSLSISWSGATAVATHTDKSITAWFPCNCMLPGGRISGYLLCPIMFAACLKIMLGLWPRFPHLWSKFTAWVTSIWTYNIALLELGARTMNTNMLMLI